jgi:hypothetical protein
MGIWAVLSAVQNKANLPGEAVETTTLHSRNHAAMRLLRCTATAQHLAFLARRTERREESRAAKNERRRKKEENTL